MNNIQHLIDTATEELTARLVNDPDLMESTQTVFAFAKRESKPMIAKFGKYEGKEICKAFVATLATVSLSPERIAAGKPGFITLQMPVRYRNDWFLVADLDKWESQTIAAFGKDAFDRAAVAAIHGQSHPQFEAGNDALLEMAKEISAL